MTEWIIRELAAQETHPLRRAVSADGRTDLPTMRHELDGSPGAWHLGAVDTAGRVVAISSLYRVPSPHRPASRPAVQLQFMAVDPAMQRRGIGSAIMAEILRRLEATDAVLLWANARDLAVPFYRRFGFEVVEGSSYRPPETGRPHRIIELDLSRPRA
ncbi:MAG: GNAT family N-acetyltransferase [Actinobacteria bacterium]|nr:GNAT family N-acetyltransferase [Actinomycetota bacterium]